ncbi:MAG: hypothetical protein Q4B50_02945 [Bacillota bacterium]|nr:hypothetical protein [Bacillota bacterium]
MKTYSFDLGQVRSGIRILGYYESLELLEAAVLQPAAGDIYAVGSAPPYLFYCWDAVKKTWVNNGTLQGERGEAGSLWWYAGSGSLSEDGERLLVYYQDMSGLKSPAADTVQIGELLLYDGAVFQISSVSSEHCICRNRKLFLQGPPGETGPAGRDGQAASIRIGSVSSGEEAAVYNAGTEQALILDFTLPRGEKGVQGEQGPAGPQGLRGLRGESGNKWWTSSSVTPDGNYGRFFFADLEGSGSVNIGDFILYNGQVFFVEGLYDDFCRAAFSKVDLRGRDGADGADGADGEDGADFVILGYYTSLSQLQAAVPSPAAGAAYGVGSAAPYDIYVWDAVHGLWTNNGSIQGPGGEDGATFTPSLNLEGQLSWSNDKNLPNPETVNIRGPQGRQGDPGPQGLKGDTGGTGPQGPSGEAGATFRPSLNEEGLLSWSNDKNLPNPDSVNIRGPQGQQGPAGPNEVSSGTASSLSGLLKGSGGRLAAAEVGTDYLAPSAKGAANGLASLDGSSKLSAAQASARIVSVTSNKSLALTDAGTLQQVNSSSSRTITVPANSGVAFPVGTEIEILRYGSGAVTIAAVSGVTLRCSETARTIEKQYSGVSLKKLASNEWLLMGGLG